MASLEQGLVGEEILEGEVFDERLAVEFGLEPGMREQRLDLGSEQERRPGACCVDGLHAEAVGGGRVRSFRS